MTLIVVENLQKKTLLQDRKSFVKEYHKLHSVCPKCLTKNFERTTMGFSGDTDRNRCRCICGWVGVVHDLISDTIER